MNPQLTTLANGMRVVSDFMPGVQTASVGVWVDVGARAERADQNGISHMLEHMAFKGTRRRSALDIATEIEAVGGHLNAYTSREQTAYFARVLGGDLPLAVDLLADILLHSTFSADEVERERGVILQEIGEAHDTPDDLVFDLLQEAAFPAQAVGRPILGTPDLVSRFTGESLATYMADHYGPSNMIVVAAGQVQHKPFVALVEAAFAGAKDQTAGMKEPARYEGGDRLTPRPLEQLHMTLGFPGFAFSDPDFYAAQVMSMILGGGMSSRLFQEIREKRGLAYSVYSFASSLVDGGLFGIYVGTSPDKADEVTKVVAEQLANLAADVDEDEFARAKAQLKASTLMALESSGARAEQYARQLMAFGRFVSMEELVATLDGLTLNDIERVVGRLMAPRRLSLAAVGPLASMPDYATINDRFAA